MIVELGGLINTGRKNIIEVQEEACKCLVNMVAKNKNIEHVFVSQLGGALKIIALLHRVPFLVASTPINLLYRAWMLSSCSLCVVYYSTSHCSKKMQSS